MDKHEGCFRKGICEMCGSIYYGNPLRKKGAAENTFKLLYNKWQSQLLGATGDIFKLLYESDHEPKISSQHSYKTSKSSQTENVDRLRLWWP